ncbi:MAG: tetratricopeptide repeat protein [Deltaproteobacteria bacterium]|nr:tetratricopeptide repeat protein [Deltaproteobacteria bacterium]
MGKKEIFLIVGLVVLSLVVGVVIGKRKGTTERDDVAVPPTAYKENRDEGIIQPPTNQPPFGQYDFTVQIQKILKEKPNDAKAFSEVGDIYFDQHKFIDAIEYYKKAIDMDKQDIDSYNDIGLAYHYIGKSDEGLKYVEEGIKRNPVYQRVWLTKGFILAVTGNITDAKSAWEKAYSLDPNSDIGRSAASFLAQHQGVAK